MSKLNAHDKLINLFNAVAESEFEETMTKTTKQLIEEWEAIYEYNEDSPYDRIMQALKEAAKLIDRLSISTYCSSDCDCKGSVSASDWLKKNGFEE